MTKWIIALAIVVAAALAPLAFAERQPHMEHALHALENAKAQLQKAEHDKGGHRVKAIQLIEQAIQEVQAGIEYDNAHPEQPKR